MSKFPHETAEALYADQADEEYGNSSEGIGWAGIYHMYNGDENLPHVEGSPYIVLVERTDGFVDFYRCRSLDHARNIASEFDN